MTGSRRGARIGSAIAGLVCGLTAAIGAVGETGPAGPRIRFEVTTHDFGKLRSDQRTEYAWAYRNDGTAPLRITGTRPQCGCTATVIDDRDVPPGGSGTILVTFDPAGLDGSIRKSLAVMSNDPTRGTVLLTLRAQVERVETPAADGSHPSTAGRSLLSGECVSCHASPATGRTGADLYRAVCAMCHGPAAEGGAHGPSLRAPGYLSSHTDDELRTAIAYGTANPRMPGFSAVMGGPLDDAQVDSIVRLLRSWGSAPAKPAPAAP